MRTGQIRSFFKTKGEVIRLQAEIERLRADVRIYKAAAEGSRKLIFLDAAKMADASLKRAGKDWKVYVHDPALLLVELAVDLRRAAEGVKDA